jgi:membrane protein
MQLPRIDKKVLGCVREMFAGMQKVRSFGLAAEVSFWLFLSLIPLAAVAGLVAAKLAVGNASTLESGLATFPPAVRELIVGQVARVAAWNGGAVAPVAAGIFVWLASSGVHAVFDVLEVQTGARERPWWKKRLLAIATCIGFSIGVAVVALLMTGIGWITHLAGEAIPEPLEAISKWSIVGKVIRLILGAILAFGLVAGLYWVGVPRGAQTRCPIAPGAALAVVLQILLGYGYGFYISRAGRGDAYLAGLAVIGLTMMTLYLFSTALLVGAQLNRVIAARRRSGPEARQQPNVSFTSRAARPT